ncbi:MAG: hypothetical protein GZ087_13655 [Flavobacterium sp.]|nr:hypothetical protein [Flavobacterium sp.]
MRKLNLKLILLFAVLLNGVFSCSSDSSSSNAVDPNPVINTVKNGTWKITFYENSGVNETTNFTGYNFIFGSNSVLTATNGANTYAGTWSVTIDNSGDDSPSNDLDFNIAFATSANFSNLTDDWNILERTDTKIKLVHVSGGNGGTDYITFEKN